jgi:ATP-dependent Clp protease protease subunit
MTVYVQFNHGITNESVNALTNAIGSIISNDNQGNIDLDDLYILFNSGGGQVDPGISLFNFLNGLSYPITMHNVGGVDSVATVIFLAGDTRYAAPGSSFLFHGVAQQFQQGLTLSLPRLREQLSSLEKDQEKVNDLISSNCDLTDQQLDRLNQQGQSQGLQWAMNESIIDKILPVDIPSGSEIVTVN